ncbi:MAG TPA: energy transducer TonB [Bryobacteraceae bacterium]|nr:energy transducer TonB [Bryobacteraceae bacterium]
MRVRINSESRTKSHEEGLFETRAPGLGGPSPVCMVGSICFHSVAIIGLWSLSLYQPPPPPPLHTSANIDPTVIRIGDKLFFVQRLAPREDEPPKPKPAEEQKLAAKATSVKLQAPPATTQAAARQAPRVFVPPEIKRNLISESTLIQPLSPPDLVPPNTPLPSFRVFTAQLPKIPKPFIVPGRRTPTPPDPSLPPPPPPPNIDLASAAPALNPPPSRLVLPPAPPPVIEDQPPKPLTALPPSRAGDAANILSLSDRPVAPSDKLVVPPGNVLGATGDGVVLRAGTVDGDSSGAAARSGDGRSSGPGAAGANNGANSGANSAASGANSGVNGGRGAGSSGTPGNAAGGVSILGGGASSNPPIPKGGMQRRASNGTFDAVVVQSSSGDPFPESKELLTGRPIYTVYVALGTPKDWALYFCVPGEKDASPGGNVVKIGTAVGVQAPYPTTLVRPDVAVPSFYKQVLVHGYVTAAGRVENLKVVRPIKPETDQALLAALARWDFRPATRDGVNIGVEFVLSIPVAGL